MSILLKSPMRRREALRGIIGGTAVTVGLPFLDCFLNNSGTALASGAPLPVRFGTWFWGLGHQPGIGISEKAQGIDLLLTTKSLERHKKNMNYYSGFKSSLDGTSNYVHYSGPYIIRTGSAPLTQEDIPATTIDVLVSDVIGGNTRFRSLEMVGQGGPRASYSARNSGSRNAGEVSPLALYARIFGSGFVDPNNAEFKPDPRIMVRKSVLSGVQDQSKKFAQTLGNADRARMDAYFTSIRELEQQLALELQQPPPNKACIVPPNPEGELPENIGMKEDPNSRAELGSVINAHRLMAKTLAMAVACNQTKVFSMTFSQAGSGLRRAGSGMTHHSLSHEDLVDAKLGYQPAVAHFDIKSMESLAEFIDIFSAIPEGDRTLLDNTFIMAHSDSNDAKVHLIDAIPVMSFGKAGGRVKTGIHVSGNGDAITRIGLTAMQVMGVPVQTWGTKSNQTSKTIREILV
jgi:hypothetical protein